MPVARRSIARTAWRRAKPVLKALRGGGIDVVAIHHHMSGEQPRVLFLHYWGRGAAANLAKTVKAALDLTAWDGRAPIT